MNLVAGMMKRRCSGGQYRVGKDGIGDTTSFESLDQCNKLVVSDDLAFQQAVEISDESKRTIGPLR